MRSDFLSQFGVQPHPGFAGLAPSQNSMLQALVRAGEEGRINSEAVRALDDIQLDPGELFNRLDTQSNFGERLAASQFDGTAARSPFLDAAIFNENAKNATQGLDYLRDREPVPPARLGRSRAARLANDKPKYRSTLGAFWEEARRQLQAERRLDTEGEAIDSDPLAARRDPELEGRDEGRYRRARKARADTLIEERARELKEIADAQEIGVTRPRYRRVGHYLDQPGQIVEKPQLSLGPPTLGGSKKDKMDAFRKGVDLPYVSRGRKAGPGSPLRAIAAPPGEPPLTSAMYVQNLGSQAIEETYSMLDRIAARRPHLNEKQLVIADRLDAELRRKIQRQSNTMEVLSDAAKYIRRGHIAPPSKFPLDTRLLLALGEFSTQLLPSPLRAILRKAGHL